MNDERYNESRVSVEARFRKLEPVASSRSKTTSPSGRYEIDMCTYTEGPDTWDYSRGVVRSTETVEIIADIKRNIGNFWHTWVLHSNGHEYLLCGEDYQGYQAINLSTKKVHTYFPERGHVGSGFCWAAVYPSSDAALLVVDGCYWACPYDMVVFDFTSPDILPYMEIARYKVVEDCEGWIDEDTFAFTIEVECRKSDWTPYWDLSEEEQVPLDEDNTLIGYRNERITLHRHELLKRAEHIRALNANQTRG